MSTEQVYENPIRAWDIPDPDAIPLDGGGYALVASSFDRRPGLPLWRSDDLVEWTPVGFAGGWQELVQPSGGVWAPAIRQHGGRLYITWADPDRGVYATDAAQLEGPWSAPRLLIAGAGRIDPCPLWDDDGRVWIVHGWARSRAGSANRLDLVEVDARLTTSLGGGRVLIDGDAIDGCHTLEGPKLYRRDGRYVVFAPAGGVATGWQYVFRADDLAGPWGHRIVLAQGASDVNGPHQGAWVVGADGEEWFLHFQHTPRHGRILHLQPLVWSDDGWPRVGQAVVGGPAEPVPAWRRPTPRPGRTEWEPATAGAGWHGLGADPADLVVESGPAGPVALREGGRLGRPLDRRASTVAVTLLSGAGSLSLVGAETHTVHAIGPARLGAVIEGDHARFVVDGEPGERFELAPTQWTGVDVAIAADTGIAAFDLP
ncbi:family 43 glycosylhydrolase [Planococcus sp. APC 4015]|nr:family 43 glycosylhydrolase [Planococcus sp. APC 4015]